MGNVMKTFHLPRTKLPVFGHRVGAQSAAARPTTHGGEPLMVAGAALIGVALLMAMTMQALYGRGFFAG